MNNPRHCTEGAAFCKRVRLLIPFLITVVAAIGVLFTPPAAALEAVPALIDLRTAFSDGAYDPETLVQMAVKKGFGVIVLNDHDRMVMEYGLRPFRNIVKKREERASINKTGAGRYLQTIESIRRLYPEVILIPGTESTPFYYWTGSPFTGNLTANDHERRILTIGMENPGDYRTLPVLHNDYSRPDLKAAAPSLAAFGLSFLIALFFLFTPGWWRISGVLLAIANVAFFINILFARPSPFDAYHGKQGAAPYQLFIDDVVRKGGLTFWNYPETRSGVRQLGPIKVKTLPYPEMLLETRNYTGFAALYGDTITITEPGNIWDVALKEYCRGFRDRPPWGIATADFHREGGAGQNLGDFQTVLWLAEKSQKSVLAALRSGRMYACQGKFPQIPRLDEFSVSPAEPESASRVISGDEIVLERNPRIRITISAPMEATEAPEGVEGGKDKKRVKVRLIRSDTIIQTFTDTLPLTIDFTDTLEAPGEMVYYRMDMTGYGTIVSNPIFVKFTK